MTLPQHTLHLPQEFVVHFSKASFPLTDHGLVSVIAVLAVIDIVVVWQFGEKAGQEQNVGRTVKKPLGQTFVFC